MCNNLVVEFIEDKIKRLRFSRANDDIRFALWLQVLGFIDGCFYCDRISAEEFHEYSELAKEAYTEYPLA